MILARAYISISYDQMTFPIQGATVLTMYSRSWSLYNAQVRPTRFGFGHLMSGAVRKN